ncbi:hypothetical protein TW95_gp1027 [Pandoravirus inopinatum]|uniref:Uncharacterized protein n=1 Tax=Pandoravirus inopinatum TaxID=1605721 RepID=A0A0B5JA48_9VIRU|nr:hypothetical protein TW95_gp1027 [Pandoravirus inopinatum]AJF97761.1 hypothetical protein [Pandoravirus inopinatum]
MEAVTDQDRQWLDKSLACVTCDGRVDVKALDAVEFAHNFFEARALLAVERAKGIAPMACFELPAIRRSSRSGNLYALSVQSDQQATHAWVARTYPDDRDLHLPNDNTLAALMALSARACHYPFALVARVSPWTNDRRLCTSADTWLVRMSEALSLQPRPWDLAAIDRELALARALVGLLAERQEALPSSECGYTAMSSEHLRVHGDEADEAHDQAAQLFVDHGLTMLCGPCACRTRENAITALNVFIAGVERMQATPAIYLGAIAPAIAAHVQEDFAHRHVGADTGPVAPAEATTGRG